MLNWSPRWTCPTFIPCMYFVTCGRSCWMTRLTGFIFDMHGLFIWWHTWAIHCVTYMGYSLCDIHGLFIVWHTWAIHCVTYMGYSLCDIHGLFFVLQQFNYGSIGYFEESSGVCFCATSRSSLDSFQIVWIVENSVSMYIVKAILQYQVMNIFVWIYKIRFNCKIVSDQELW